VTSFVDFRSIAYKRAWSHVAES